MLPQLDSVVLYLTLTAVCQSKVRYRTASDSDRPFIKSVGRQQKAGRYHHPKRAARLGTPVRSRFCNDGPLLLPTLDRDPALKVFLIHVMDPLSGSLCDLPASVVRVSLRPELAKTTTTRYNSRHSLIAPISCCAPVAQRLEQQTHNLLVRGSNPCGGTNQLASCLTLTGSWFSTDASSKPRWREDGAICLVLRSRFFLGNLTTLPSFVLVRVLTA